MTRLGAAEVVAWLAAFARLVEEHTDELTALDAAIGDADHGTNLHRGTRAVTLALAANPPDTPGAAARLTAGTLISTVGGASGPLYGTFFLRFAGAAGAQDSLDAAGLGRALRAGVEGVVERGRTAPGDKTMVDAWLPACAAFEQSDGTDLGTAVAAAAEAAAAGRDATAPLVARKGRASYLGERSAGHVDPGAASTALLLRAAADVLRPAHPGGSARGGEAS